MSRADWSMTNSKTALENASHGAPREKHFKHAELHDNYGVGTFLLRMCDHENFSDKIDEVPFQPNILPAGTTSSSGAYTTTRRSHAG